MSEGQRAHFRASLEHKKQELLRDIDRAVHTLQEEPTLLADPSDRAAQEADIGIEVHTRHREGNLIRKIEESISRLDNRSYGYCVTCGAEIGLERLEARPTATLCIDCKTLAEVRERQVAPLRT